MANISKIAVISVFLISLAGCGGTTETVKNSSSPTANMANPVNPANSANVETASNANVNAVTPPGISNSKKALTNVDNMATNVDPRMLRGVNTVTATADNSEMVTILNEKGAIETRTFKSNPLLSKIERTSYGKDVTLKVYLKNGKVIPVANDKIGNFAQDSAQQILEVAGVQMPKPPPNPNTGAATGAKEENPK